MGDAVNVVLAAVTSASHLPQNPAGDAAFEIGTLAQGKIAGELDAAADGVDLFGLERAQLIGKNQLEAARAGSKKLFHDSRVNPVDAANSIELWHE